MAGTTKSCIFLIGLSCCLSKNLPSFIQKCKLEYPAVNDCLLQHVKDLKPYLEKGIPEMKLPALKPLKIPKVEVQTGSGSSSAFNATFTDIIVTGAEDFEVKKIDYDLDNQKADLEVYIPRIYIKTTYNFKGKLLILELNASGPAECNITNINSKSHASIKKITKNGKQYLELEDKQPIITYDKPKLHFEDLFKGNKELTEHTNDVINENLSEIGKEIQPLIDSTIHAFIMGTIIQVYKEFSLDELFT